MRHTAYFLLVAFALCLPLTACGGSSAPPSSSRGLVTVSALDDPAVDVGTFAVSIQSMHLVRVGGGSAPLLGAPTVVDFAAAMDDAVLFAIASVPAGSYEALDVVFDFSTLEARRTNGAALEVRGEDGTSPLQQTVQLRLRLREALSIGPQDPAHLVLDCPLCECLEPMEGYTNRVRMRAMLQVMTQEQAQVRTRLEGELATVESTGPGAGFAVDVTPPGATEALQLRLRTHAHTACNGTNGGGQGNSGLNQMQSHLRERVMVTARLRDGQDPIEADEVCYGGSLPGDAVDTAMGYVADFDGTEFTIIGARLTRGAGGEELGETLTAIIDATSPVLRRGGPVDATDIGIGQHVLLSGTLTPGTPPVLDCTAAAGGTVRMMETSLRGLVDSVAPGVPDSHVLLEVTHFGQYPVELFDLLGHGVDPTDYDVLTEVDVSTLAAGDAVVCRGFVLAADPTADFEAFAVALQESTDAVLSVSWEFPGIAEPFGGATAFPLSLDLTGAYVAEVTSQHGTVVFTLAGSPTIELPLAGPAGPFSIREAGVITSYDGADVAAWLADLDARLASGRAAIRLTGAGAFEDGSPQVYTADALSITVR